MTWTDERRGISVPGYWLQPRLWAERVHRSPLRRLHPPQLPRRHTTKQRPGDMTYQNAIKSLIARLRAALKPRR
jgi:hypothetical protein